MDRLRTIKLTLKPEPRNGMAIELEVEALFGNEDEAYAEGQEIGSYITRFLGGFSETDVFDGDSE